MTRASIPNIPCARWHKLAVVDSHDADTVVDQAAEGGAGRSTRADEQHGRALQPRRYEPRCGPAKPGDVGVVTVDEPVLAPEGVAGPRALDLGAGSVDAAGGLRLVREGDIPSATREGETSHQAPERGLRALEGDIDRVEPPCLDGRPLHHRREGMSNRPTEDREDPGTTRERAAHGSSTVSS